VPLVLPVNQGAGVMPAAANLATQRSASPNAKAYGRYRLKHLAQIVLGDLPRVRGLEVPPEAQ
jgi:hypothetical protein